MTIPPKLSKLTSSYSNSFKHFFIAILVILILFMITVFLIQTLSFTKEAYQYIKVELRNLHKLPEVKILEADPISRPRNPLCTHWDCFDVYRCGHTGHERISVYVYPLKKFVDEKNVPAVGVISKEFYMILHSIIKSKYYTANPHEACLYVPSIDTLNQDRIRINVTSKALQSLPYWNNGRNHLLFNMLSGMAPDFSTVLELNIANAVIAGAGFNSYSFRVGFDVSIPIYTPVSKLGELKQIHNDRPWFVISSQLNIDSYFLDELRNLQSQYSDILIIDACQVHNYTKRCEFGSHMKYKYPQILQQSIFCLVFRGERMSQLVLLEAMAANCIPVIVMDGVVMPFSSVIDWKRAAFFVMEDYLNTLMDVLKKVSKERIREMQKQVRFLYLRYFSDIKCIVETTLDIIQDRVYPHWSKTYDDWNRRPDEIPANPLFLPITASRVQGFTAEILTYDRVDSLFTLIDKLSKVPSMTKIVVIWNNQKKAPPPLVVIEHLEDLGIIRNNSISRSNVYEALR